MSESELKGCINQLLFRPTKNQTDKELLSLVVLRDKKDKFDFLEGYTKWNAIGTWREVNEKGNVLKEYPKEKNIQLEVEFRDTPDESVGNRLMDLFKEFNKKVVKEEDLI